ncbi:hypothetical protein C4585_01920 [Candidatus Parcubacteria bacterium]|nr:MAG: hypothetical protein C4585_01920 [Candidatus Parcubacteria bacterium]
MEGKEGLRDIREKIQNEIQLTEEERFVLKKGKFFSALALHVKEALALHKKEGLWERKEGKRDWGNVSEHCLVEIARVEEFAQLLGVSEQTRKKLVLAAALHDYYKRREVEYARTNGKNWAALDVAGEGSVAGMRETGFSEDVIEIVNSVGHTSLLKTQGLLKNKKEELNEHQLAYLVMHYVDDYTSGSNWADPLQQKEDGTIVNAFDKRMEKNVQNKDYQIRNEEGRARFDGRTTFDAQYEIGAAVEKRLAEILSEKTGEVWDPKLIPEKIDARIKERIRAFAQ